MMMIICWFSQKSNTEMIVYIHNYIPLIYFTTCRSVVVVALSHLFYTWKFHSSFIYVCQFARMVVPDRDEANMLTHLFSLHLYSSNRRDWYVRVTYVWCEYLISCLCLCYWMYIVLLLFMKQMIFVDIRAITSAVLPFGWK